MSCATPGAAHTRCRGGATAVGALGYVAASLELAGQLTENGLAPTPTQLWLATGSGGTQAGLHAGIGWLRPGYEVVGVTVSRPVDECSRQVAQLAGAAAELIHAPSPTASPVVIGGHLGPGYGCRSPEGEVVAQLVARTEGVFLDPVFGAKAMAALLAAVDAGTVAGPVVFLVTGGAPTLFTVPSRG